MPDATLTFHEIAGMRETSDSSLPDVAIIYRRQRVSDGGGGWTYTWPQFGDEVPCRLGKPGGGETDVREVSRTRLADEETQVVFFPAKTDVDEADRIEIEGRLYEVYSVLGRGQWEIVRRVRVREFGG